MPIGVDVVRGAIRLDGFQEGRCFTSWADFVAALPGMLAVEIPTGITNVTIGNQTPSDTDRDHLWLQTDGSGSFLGFYIYTAGAWQQIYPAPNQLFLMYGDSRSPPPGYTVATDDPNISASMLANLQKVWTLGGTSPDWWTVFHATYTGF